MSADLQKKECRLVIRDDFLAYKQFLAQGNYPERINEYLEGCVDHAYYLGDVLVSVDDQASLPTDFIVRDTIDWNHLWTSGDVSNQVYAYSFLKYVKGILD